MLTSTLEESTIRAGFWGSTNQVIAIPPYAVGHQETQDCAIPTTMHVFAAFAHMHQRGTKFEFFLNGATFFSQPWSFNDQPTVPLIIDMPAGSIVTSRCTYDNPGATSITYGESSNQEMCAGVLYHYPQPAFVGCTKTP